MEKLPKFRVEIKKRKKPMQEELELLNVREKT